MLKTPPLTPESPRKGLLTFEGLNIMKELVIKIFDAELSRPRSLKEAEVLKSFFLSLYFEQRLYTLFIPRHLIDLSESVFTESCVRDLVLNLTDRVSVLLAVEDFDLDAVAETITQGVCFNKTAVDDRYSLINSDLRMSFEVKYEDVKGYLVNNFWLTCLVILYMFMYESMLFDEQGGNPVHRSTTEPA